MSFGDSYGSRWVRAFAFLGGVLVLGFVGSALFGDDGVTRHEKLRGDLGELQKLNEALSVENARLTRQAVALRQDPEFIESVIRDELGWVRGDELVFIFAGEGDR